MTATLLFLRIGLSAVAATVAALAAERALRELGRQARGIWAAALLGTAGMTVWLLAGGSLPLGLPGDLANLILPAGMDGDNPLPNGDAGVWPALLGLLWMSTSVLLGLVLVVGARRQRHDLAGGRRERFGRIEATVCPTLGPAAVGIVRPRIVIPEWLLELPSADRELVLLHEAEHAAARDPLVTWAGLCLVCLLPWHPVIWYQFRRLRLAIEMDCDTRVTRSQPGRLHEYGRLLIELTGRGGRQAILGAALGLPRTFLHRRIQMITRRRGGFGHAVLWAAVALGLGVLACMDPAGPAMEAPSRDVVLRPIPDETDSGDMVRLRAVAQRGGEQSARLRAVTPPEENQSELLHAAAP